MQKQEHVPGAEFRSGVKLKPRSTRGLNDSYCALSPKPFERAIRAAAVNDDNFVNPSLFAQCRQTCWQEIALVQNRNNDGYFHLPARGELNYSDIALAISAN